MKKALDWIVKRIPKRYYRKIKFDKSEDINGVFLGLTSALNAMAKISGKGQDMFIKDDQGIIYLPVIYVKAIREVLIHMYKESEDPIVKGYMSKSNLNYTMEYVIHHYNNESKKEMLIKKSAFILYNITSKHPFTDGNKRTGLIVANSFLEYNGYSISHLPYRESYNFILAVAKGEKGEKECQQFIRKHISELRMTIEEKESFIKLIKDLESLEKD